MAQNLENVYQQISGLKTDLDELRSTYKGISESYSIALSTLNNLTINSTEAAKRASNAAEQCRIAALYALQTARDASISPELELIVQQQ